MGVYRSVWTSGKQSCTSKPSKTFFFKYKKGKHRQTTFSPLPKPHLPLKFESRNANSNISAKTLKIWESHYFTYINGNPE